MDRSISRVIAGIRTKVDYSLSLSDVEAEILAMMDSLPLDEKAAYLEALRRCPGVVRVESNVHRFLRAHDFNHKRAAQKLASHWTKRKELFGERAFRPLLDLSGRGALSDQDLLLIRSGMMVLLPEDAEGRPVVCTNPERLGYQIVSAISKLRLMFYWYVRVSENPVAQQEGIVLLRIKRKPNYVQHDHQNQVLDLLNEALPVKIHSLHWCCIMPTDIQHTFQNTLVPHGTRLFQENLRIQKQPILHLTNTAEQMLACLEAHGLKRRNLPPTLGGAWTYADFDSWGSECLGPLLDNAKSSKMFEKRKSVKRKLDLLCRNRSRDNTFQTQPPLTRPYLFPTASELLRAPVNSSSSKPALTQRVVARSYCCDTGIENRRALRRRIDALSRKNGFPQVRHCATT